MATMDSRLCLEISFLAVYLFVGIGALGYLVSRPLISRWGRFWCGMLSIAFGTVGALFATQVLESIKDALQFILWNHMNVSTLGYMKSATAWISIFLPFVFASVGAGLVVNAITTEKNISTPPSNRSNETTAAIAQ